MPHRAVVTTLGPAARRVLSEEADGTVIGVFRSSVHVALPAGVCCLVAPGLGNGPLNAVCDAWQEEEGAAWDLREGTPVRREGSSLHLGAEVTFDLSAAADWRPSPWPACWNATSVRRTLEHLGALAEARAPRDGFATIAFGEPVTGGFAGIALRKALLATATLSDWLTSASREDVDSELERAARTAAVGLVGLGPGLTPSGDDLLAGMLVALRAAGRHETARHLGQWVSGVAPEATTAFSRAALTAAAEGHAAEAMADVIASILSGDDARLPQLIEPIAAIGHTSGWDMLAGVTLALAAVTASRA